MLIIIKRLTKRCFSKRKSITSKAYPEYLHDLCGSHSAYFSFDKGLLKNCEANSSRMHTINSIDLAGISLPVKDLIQWDVNLEDDEDFVSLHRWNWLVVKLSETADKETFATWGISQINNWLNKFIDTPKDSLIWEPYTTGERVCNFLVFVEVTGVRYDENLKNAFCIMAMHVLDNLEYYGEKDTFNHLINNARALYFAGQYLKLEIFTEAANAILKNELHKLITKDGFLREGSSHYQFLFTRWMLEILFVARKYKDDDIISLIITYVVDLVKQCRFFLVFDKEYGNWNIPLIGDVSPDFKPEWLITLPWSPLALALYNPVNETNSPEIKGWSNLFKFTEDKKFDSLSKLQDAPVCVRIRTDKQEDTVQAYNNSGWYRFDYKSSTLFLHVEPNGIPEFPGHFHNDLCSFSLYLEGSPLLVDIGRLSYCNDYLSRYGISAKAHNSLQIDGLDPYPDKKFPEIWTRFCDKPTVFWAEGANSLEIKIKQSGFKRIFNDKVNHERKFVLFSTHMVIEDYLEGNSKHSVESFFHFANKLKLEQTNNDNTQFKVVGENRSYNFYCELPEDARLKAITTDSETPAGWYFPEYGGKIPVWTVVCMSRGTFPTKHRYTIKWN